MKLRIQNNSRGERGVYLGEELTFIAAGATRTFDNATKADLKAVEKNREFRVQSSDDGKKWEDHSEVELPAAKPFLAVAKGSNGESARYIPLEDGEWFIGTALVSEAPEGPQGYEWNKVGAASVAAPEPVPQPQSFKMVDTPIEPVKTETLVAAPPKEPEATKEPQKPTETPRRGRPPKS